MKLTHALRASHDAILIGIETLLADNPRLNVRLVEGPNPQPVVVDSQLRMAPQARLFAEHAQVWVATTSTAIQKHPDRRAALAERGATILALPANEHNQVDLPALLQALGQRQIRSLMEGGARMLSSMLAQQLADFAVVTIAPIYVGGYRVLQPQNTDELSAPLFSAATPPRLANPLYTPIGSDIVVWGAVATGAPTSA